MAAAIRRYPIPIPHPVSLDLIFPQKMIIRRMGSTATLLPASAGRHGTNPDSTLANLVSLGAVPSSFSLDRSPFRYAGTSAYHGALPTSRVSRHPSSNPGGEVHTTAATDKESPPPQPRKRCREATRRTVERHATTSAPAAEDRPRSHPSCFASRLEEDDTLVGALPIGAPRLFLPGIPEEGSATSASLVSSTTPQQPAGSRPLSDVLQGGSSHLQRHRSQLGQQVPSTCAPVAVGITTTLTGGAALPFATLTAKVLKQRCAAAGLLTTGTKADLRHRWHLFIEQQQQQDHTTDPSWPNVDEAAGETVSSTLALPDLELSRIPNTLPPVSSVSTLGSPLLATSPCVDRPPTNTASKGGGVSPPRTRFLYDSRSTALRGGTPIARAPAFGQSPPPTPYVVPSPDAFVEGIIRQGTSSSTLTTEVSAAATTPPWQLLVDHREKVYGKHDNMLAILQRQQTPCLSQVLPCGDFMLNVTGDGPLESRSGLGEPGSGLYPYLLPVVIERKTLADLDASIKGSRYTEQRRLLALSPFTLVIWVIEGMADAPPACRRRNAVPHHSSSRSGMETGASDACVTPLNPRETDLGRFVVLSESQRRVDAACASLSLQRKEGVHFVVVRTRNVQESAMFLKQLGHSMIKQQTDSRHWLDTTTTLQQARDLQKLLRAQSAFPRMLLSIRGCSPTLACMLVNKYGSLYLLWRQLQDGGPSVCDDDPDIQQLTVPQKKVVVLLTEFLLSKEYY